MELLENSMLDSQLLEPGAEVSALARSLSNSSHRWTRVGSKVGQGHSSYYSINGGKVETRVGGWKDGKSLVCLLWWLR